MKYFLCSFLIFISVGLMAQDSVNYKLKDLQTWVTTPEDAIQIFGEPDCIHKDYSSANYGFFRIRTYYTFYTYERNCFKLMFTCYKKPKKNRFALKAIKLDSCYVLPQVGKSISDSISIEEILSAYGSPVDSLLVRTHYEYESDSVDVSLLNDSNSYELKILSPYTLETFKYKIPNEYLIETVNYRFNKTCKITFVIENEFLSSTYILSDSADQFDFTKNGEITCEEIENLNVFYEQLKMTDRRAWRREKRFLKRFKSHVGT